MKLMMIAFGLLVSTWAHAHGGHSTDTGFWSGFLHAFSGLDHCLALAAGSVWLSRKDWPKRLRMLTGFALLFGLAMITGMTAGSMVIDWALIGAAVVVLASVMAYYRWYAAIATSLLAIAATLFGFAHGTELAAPMAGIGAVIAASLALFAGAYLCCWLRRVTLRVVRI